MPHITPEERDDLIVEHLPLVTHIAGYYRNAARQARVEWDDLIQEGAVGLIKAADRYSPTRYPGKAFSTYAWIWIQNSIFRALATRLDLTGLDMDRLPSRPRPPQLVPLFPITVYDAQSTCPHHGPIRRGSLLCCMVCHRSGMDHHAAFQRDRATDPKPDKKPAPARPGQRETRRQRRARLYAAPETRAV